MFKSTRKGIESHLYFVSYCKCIPVCGRHDIVVNSLDVSQEYARRTVLCRSCELRDEIPTPKTRETVASNPLVPSMTVQQFRLDHGMLCSVPWQHSQTLWTPTASVPESAHAAGREPVSQSMLRILYCAWPERLTIDAAYSEKLAWESLPHAARDSPHARFFSRVLALSLLQPKPDQD